MPAPASAPAGNAPGLPVGAVVGGRFRIDAHLRSEAGTDLYRATDGQGGATVLLRLVGAAPPAVRAALEADLARAGRVQHKNLAAVLATGDYAGQLFVAAETEEAHTLRELVDAQASQHKTVGLASAQTLLGHVAFALEELHKVMPHGGLHPASVWVTRTGRVKVGDLGLPRGLPGLARRGSAEGAPEGLYVAPEVARGVPPGAGSDVYSMGAILYELLTGRPPALPLPPPSRSARDVSPGVDAVVSQAMAPQASARFATPVELVSALAKATDSPTPVGAAMSNPGAPRVSLSRSFDVARASGLSQSDERWLVQKDKLDYGPFSLAQIMAQIERGVFGSEHFIVEVDSGERQKIKEHPMLADFAFEAGRKLEAARRAQAEHAQSKVERKKSKATGLILGAAVAAIAVGGFFYFKSRKAAEDDVLASRVGEAEVDAFVKQFRLDVPRRKATARRAGGRGDDFSSAMVLGDVTQAGGDEILSDGVIQNVMMGNYRKLVPCLMVQRRRDPSLSDVEIELVVLGSGRVSAVRVNGQQKGDFPACVLGKMQSFGFPSYNGKKTIASWSMAMR